MVKKNIDEEAVNFYETHLLSQSDLVFRSCYAFSLDLDVAKSITNETFKEISDTLETLIKTEKTEFKRHLLDIAWKKYLASSSSKPKGDSAISRALSPIEKIARGALALVDLAGLRVVAASEILGINELDLRKQLAAARRELMMSTLKY